MFEKEADLAETEMLIHCNGDYSKKKNYREGWQDGATFGYNKANEWHYPSKGEYPKVGTWIIGFYYGKNNWHKIFYRTDGKWWGEGQLCQPPFAWKEVTLPKEIKEND